MKKRKTIMRSLAKTQQAWQNHVRIVTLAEGIPESYKSVLMFLLRHPGSSQRSIAEFAGVTTSAINQVVKSMQEEDYLRKETDPCDKRNSRLTLTEKGQSVAEKLFAKLDASDDAITAMIGPDREAELIALLEQLADFIGKDLA